VTILNDEETALESHGGDRIEIALAGRELPSLTLNSTAGPVLLRELGRELLVLFIYPHATGLPVAPVPGWDSIPGARGCTAQSCAFRDHQAQLSELGVALAGLSVQTVNEQREFALRVGIDYRLISDRDLLLAAALGLPTFGAGGRTFYRRLTIVAEKGAIARVFYPVVAPEQNAAEIVAWLESRPPPSPFDDIES
jgi:peroxiredoxin